MPLQVSICKSIIFFYVENKFFYQTKIYIEIFQKISLQIFICTHFVALLIKKKSFLSLPQTNLSGVNQVSVNPTFGALPVALQRKGKN